MHLLLVTLLINPLCSLRDRKAGKPWLWQGQSSCLMSVELLKKILMNISARKATKELIKVWLQCGVFCAFQIMILHRQEIESKPTICSAFQQVVNWFCDILQGGVAKGPNTQIFMVIIFRIQNICKNCFTNFWRSKRSPMLGGSSVVRGGLRSLVASSSTTVS